MANQFEIKIVSYDTEAQAIEIVRAHCPSLTLEEAKELANSGGTVATEVDEQKAEEIKAELEAAGVTVEIRPLPELRLPLPNLPLEDLKDKLGPGKDVVPRLQSHEIKTLADIRRAGGLAGLEKQFEDLQDLPDEEKKAAKRLEAHAYLNLLSGDPEVNTKLLDHFVPDDVAAKKDVVGSAMLADIARLPRPTFLRQAQQAGVAEDQAGDIHAKAKALQAYFSNIITAARVEQANGFDLEPVINLGDVFEQPCQCLDRESAVSPAAYLADLLDYAATHIEKRNGDDLEPYDTIEEFLEDLEARFHQPFGRLPASTEEVERKVRQVRLCVEVLRGYLDDNKKYPDYLFQAYNVLLNQIGTSYRELRLAKTAPSEKRQALADRLGLGLSNQRPDALDELLLAPETISEQILESLFGLVDTTRDPLCDGVKFGDRQNQIRQWNLSGVEWNKNTDSNGIIYLRLQQMPTPVPSEPAYKLKVFRDQRRTDLIASGPAMISSGVVPVVEENDSGLSGSFDVDYKGNTDQIEIHVIPQFLAWRLQHLRTLWSQQDWPADPFTGGKVPIIDPDVIGPDDFRMPDRALSQAFQLWEKRRGWVDKQLEALAQAHDGEEGEEPEEKGKAWLGAMLALLEETLRYTTEDGVAVDKTPWSDAITVKDLIDRHVLLTRGEDLDNLKAWIADKHLSVNRFTRLAEVANQAESDEEIAEDAWQAIESILAHVQKEVFFETWCDEEQGVGITLDPRHFWKALAEPAEGVWSPALHQQRPLIDPEIVGLDDLMAPPIGEAARQTWQQRKKALSDFRQEVGDTYTGTDESLEQAFKLALGDEIPSGYNSWIDALVQINSEVGDLDPAIHDAAVEKIKTLFCMQVDDFRHLATVQAKGDAATEEEKEKLCDILTSAHKQKALREVWSEDESTEAFVYWRVLQTRRPPWRASQEARQGWQLALRRQSRPPIVDPDLIGADDLRDPMNGDAFEMRKARRVWVDAQLEALRAITPDITSVQLVGGQTGAPGQFTSPYGVAVDSHGNVYVADAGNDRVQKFDAHGNFIGQLGGEGDGIIRAPASVAVDNNDNVYVIETRRVQKFDASGRLVWDSGETEDGQFVSAQDVAVDDRGDVCVVYVADSGMHQIRKFDGEGSFIGQLGGEGEGDGEFKRPQGVAVDDNGDLYVVDSGNQRVQKFNEIGEFIWKKGKSGSEIGEFQHPQGVAVDGNGNVYVVDSGNHRIQKINTEDGSFVGTWGTQGTANGQFLSAHGVAVDGDGHVYVTDRASWRIQKFDANGHFRTQWGQNTGAGQFLAPQGVAVDGDGNVYVADTDNHRIQKFDADGKFVAEWGEFGSEDGKFHSPGGVAVDGNGYVYVADSNNWRIQKFNTNGTFLSKWGDAGTEGGQFKLTRGIAVDGDGYVYVADTGNHRIQKFDADEKFVTEWGEGPSSEDGRFHNPRGVAVDGHGYVYVADTSNHRIQKFDAHGTFLAKWGERGAEDGQFAGPRGIAVDNQGNVYVADTGNNRIQCFDTQGRFIAKWGSQGTGEKQFYLPTDVAAHGQGSLYVAEELNHRIQILTFDPGSPFQTIIERSLGVTIKDLLDLAVEREQGNGISKRLDQLNLSTEEFLHLIRFHDLLASTANVLRSEWEEVYSILVQVQKRRVFAEWRDEEKAAHITLSPDFFIIPKEETYSLPPWRASREARWDWQDKLSARIDQERGVMAAMAEAVSECEEATLTMLRDALVTASDAGGNDLSAKAKWLTDRLLIDCRTSGCMKTTRISQAITTLQNLIFSLRTGQLEGLALELVDDGHFDQEWQWIGSYEIWKAAVGVFLYPDNILLPSLRRKQTSKMSVIIEEVGRSGRRFSPSTATGLADEYSLYLQDICQDLEILEAVQYNDYIDRVFVIARGRKTKSFYMCYYDYDPHDSSYFHLSSWERIEKLEQLENMKIIGAVCSTHLKPIVYLFFWQEYTLNLIRYDITSASWDDAPTPLDLPEEPARRHAAVEKGLAKSYYRPQLIINVNGNLYRGTIEENTWAFKDDPYICLEGKLPPDLRYDGVFSCSDIGASFVALADYMDTHSYLLVDSYYRSGGEYELSLSLSTFQIQTEHKFKGWLPYYSYGSGLEFYLLSGNNSETYYQKLRVRSDSYDLDEKATRLDTNIDRLEAVALPLERSTSWEVKERVVALHQTSLVPQEEIEPPINVFQKYHSIYRWSKNQLCFDPSHIKHIALSLTGGLDLGLTNNRRKQFSQEVFDFYLGQDAPPSLLDYVWEGFYFLPLIFALQLRRAGQYTAALDWFKTVYDYARLAHDRKVFYGLKLEEQLDLGYIRSESDLSQWLQDPLNVHSIASSRKNSYTRFTLLSIVRCLLDYADAEFTRDSIESLATARTLYETALELLGAPELNQQLVCPDIIGYLDREVATELEGAPSRWRGTWRRTLRDMARINDQGLLQSTANRVADMMKNSGDLSKRMTQAQHIVQMALAGHTSTPFSRFLSARQVAMSIMPRTLLKDDTVQKGAENVLHLAKASKGRLSQSVERSMSLVATIGFCIPPNPMIRALRFQAEINLHKLRTCRNIAGMKREIEPYAAPVDVLSAMPSIGPGGQLVLPTRITPPPVPYRYEFIIERAKQLANLAAQMEAAFLSALERRDAAAYDLLKARQDVRLARAGVRLQDLRLRQAQDEVKLAVLQQESAQIQAETYQKWLDEYLNEYELCIINAYIEAAEARVNVANIDTFLAYAQALTTASTASVGAGVAFANAHLVLGFGLLRAMELQSAIVAETTAQISSIYAAQARREQDWELQKALADHAIIIGDQQIKIANGGVNIARQEKDIARLQVEQAEAVVEFLTNKFMNLELYDWMTGVLEGVYSYFLQQSTSTAKLAQNQLAFERQEPPPAFIQDDYWEVPSENSLGGATEDAVDRHGLTGSARLLADIYKLDQYRLETEKRKLQLTKSISLARLAPFEFQQFKETGILPFVTLMELFDRDFPGHYLRLIKRVRTSVVALVPPMQGIKATLANLGVSRLVGERNGLYQTITAYRPPESVALTSPSNATGLFELESQSEMMLPFEGLGVDTAWEFRMPKAANQFDYGTIADVILTIEYTALDSYDYRAQVIDSLSPKVSAERPFSFRHQFADPWYDLHNPNQTATPMTVRFRTRREDFPPNLDRLKIDQLLLYFAQSNGALPDDLKVTLRFTARGETVAVGGEAVPVDGVVSTRRNNGSAWGTITGDRSPDGEWELVLPNTPQVRNLFENEEIEDILFVITYSGRTPDWPE